jgi:hypothetical protein
MTVHAVLEKLLLNEVKSSDAVSPVIRANGSMMPAVSGMNSVYHA